MIPHLSVTLPEPEYIDLSLLGIDWDKFNLQCVKFYKKWSHIGSVINIKTIDNTLPHEQQIKPFADWSWIIDTNDALHRVKQLHGRSKQSLSIDTSDTHDLEYYCSDIVENYSYISETIERIEEYSGIEFARLKLANLKAMQVLEVLHIDSYHTRYHIPIVTNPNVFFISNDSLLHMQHTNKLYILETDKPHTAVNCSGSLDRLHLVGLPKNSTKSTVSDVENTYKQFLQYAQADYKAATVADLELNKETYKLIKLQLLQAKSKKS